ncbi:hypothetical protein ES703_23322 [subsurface metagenome]
MSKIVRTIEIIAIIIIILFIISIFTMPWPANIIIGGMVLLSFVVIVIHGWRTRKKEQDTGQTDRTDG